MKIATAMAVACLSVVGLAAGQDAQAVARHYDLNIPKQSLNTALRDFARQTGLRIALFSDTIDGNAVVGPVLGTQSAEDALKEMLAPSGLSYKIVREGTIAVLNPKDAPPAVSGPKEEAIKKSFFDRFRIGQATTSDSREEAAAGNPTVVPPSSEEDGGTKLDEIVVTAQKREEPLQDVPISISVLGGDELDRSTVQGLTEALNRVPGVATTEALQGGGTQVAIRGVTASSPLFNGAGPVAYYLDSLPFGFVKSAIAPDPTAYDLSRVEVLRGPQGTLYGASALNGVVRVLTQDANLERFELKARAATSTTDDGGGNYRADAAVNVPLIPGKLAARAVVGYQDLSGWLDKPADEDFNDAEISNVRLKLNAQPTERLSVGLSAWLSRADYGGPSQGLEDRSTSILLDEPIETDYDAYNLRLGYDFGGFSIASSTSRLDYDSTSDLDITFGGDPLLLFTGLTSEVFTEELTISSAAGGSWRWSIGGMYREAKDRTFQYVTEPIPGASRNGEMEFLDDSQSYAVFGEVTRSFNDGRFELTGGLRHFEDDLKSQEGVPNLAPDSQGNPKFHATTPRVILTWHPSQRNTLYASYGEGFRSGFDQGLLVKTQLGFPPVKPDSLKNYELGAKGSSSGGAFDYETAVYFIDWTDVQQSLSFFAPDDPNTPKVANINGESASGVGVDVAVTVRPIERLQLGASLSWNDLSFDADVISGGFVLFAKGDRLVSSPEYTAGVSADYMFPLGMKGYQGRFSTSANYTSEQNFVDLLGTPYISIGDEMLIGRVSFTVVAPARWTASLFVDNVTDEDGSPLKALFAVPDWSLRVRPRTVGLQLEYRFD